MNIEWQAWSDAEISFNAARDSLSILTEALYRDGHKVESGAVHAAILLIEDGLRGIESGTVWPEKQ